MKNFFQFSESINEKFKLDDDILDLIKKLSYTYGKISLDKDDASETIKNLVRSEYHYRNDNELPTKFYTKGIEYNTDLNLMKPSNKVRMYNYLNSLIKSKTTRGDNFEGLIAGLFNGQLSETKDSKYDLTIDGDIKISVKFIDNINENPVLGNIRNDIMKYINNIPDIQNDEKNDLLNLNLFDFLNKITIKNNGNKTEIKKILNDSFSEVTNFLFGFSEREPVENRDSNDLNISYYYIDKEYLIDLWVENDEIRCLPKQKDSYQVRVNLEKIIHKNKYTIISPYITIIDIEYLKINNVSAGERLFGSDIYRMRGSILNAILKYGKFKFIKGINGKQKEYFIFDFNKYKKKRGHYPN